MVSDTLRSVWKHIEDSHNNCADLCRGCPLCDSPLLLLKPGRPESVRVMVVTEGPNRYEPIKFLASCANLPTYPYLYTLFRGRFRPVGPDANLYWTHVYKCFLDSKQRAVREASRRCIFAFSWRYPPQNPLFFIF